MSKSLVVELGEKLKEFYWKYADKKMKAESVILFGIKYGKLLTNNNIKFEDIVAEAKLPGKYYDRELRKGVKISKYVILKIECDEV